MTEKKNKKVETRTHSKKTELNQTKVATTQNKMKKVMKSLLVIFMFIFCFFYISLFKLAYNGSQLGDAGFSDVVVLPVAFS